MAARDILVRAEPGFSPPVLDRLAPPPPPDVVVGRIEARSRPGDTVLDLYGRGGWIARAAIDRQRRAIDLESNPLTRLLAEVVLRPPDVRHLDAAFQALGASPRGETSLRLAIGELFATRCPTCGRNLVLDEVGWEADDDAPGEAAERPVRKHYRCSACRDQQGGGELRHASLSDEDVAQARRVPDPSVRVTIGERFPVPDGAEPLVDDLLDLHTPRQLASLAWILERIEGDLRAEPIEAALRLAFLHALVPASRLHSHGGRTAALRISGGRVRRPPSGAWRERNPWLALEDGFRVVRGFLQRIEGGPLGPVQARFGEDLRSLDEGVATVLLEVAGPSSFGVLGGGRGDAPGGVGRPTVALVLGQPPARPSQERLSVAYHGTAWALGRAAAATVPLEPLLAGSWRAPWSWQSAALRRALDAARPVLTEDGRAVLFLEEGGPEPLAAAVLGAAGAGFRLVDARLADPEHGFGGVVEFVAPGAVIPPGPRTRANRPLPAVPGGSGDPELVPGRGLFAAPERYDARPFSEVEARRTITDTAVEMLRARGEPAPTERLFAEVLVGLDRAGMLRRLGTVEAESAEAGDGSGGVPGRESGGDPPGGGTRRRSADPVDRLVGLVRDELAHPRQRRLIEVEPDRWWLADREDVGAAAAPLADRVEWAVYSLLSTAGPIPESAFLARIAGMFSGHDLPDEALVRACLGSYRSRASTPDGLVTSEHLLRRSAERAELLALLADGGHRLGMRVWLARAEHGRPVDGRPLAERLDERELDAYLPLVARAPLEDLEAVDCIWYVRNRATIMFEVEWTAMLGEPLLRRHARIPTEDRLVRFLVVAPDRTELVRYKIERSPLVRQALETGNWHVLKSSHLRAWLAQEVPTLDGLEPYLGLDPMVERTGEQLALFET